MLTINIITLFPELIEPYLERLPFSRAIEKGALEVNLIQLKNYAIDERGTVDGRPYGGGVGMLLRIEPVWQALESVYGAFDNPEKIQADLENTIIGLTPSGKTFTQKKAQELSKKSTITLICGRYEGMDARIKQHLTTENISIGNYVLSGGEIPALAIMEAVVRLLPEAIEKEEATLLESFSQGLDQKKEYPQFTRPETYKGLAVPEVLLSGHHEKIKKWQKDQINS
ncbi:tRNA (guanosine(37)-N1)-methyltransferase TrmD [candidate division WWE3 bacterium]|nr:tRNA (guanosine(37)-N1)-methyltransferase TrmD [candidate division WWE3 bacterium]